MRRFRSYPEEVAKRVPPGNRLVKGWPVLHYGPVPKFDEASWDLKVYGLVEEPLRLSYAELKALGPVKVQADMHCVTGWTTLDNEWEGVPFRVLKERVRPLPNADWVIAHCEYGYTSNLSRQDMDDDDVVLGLDELTADGVLAIEWAEKLPRPTPGAIVIRIAHGDADSRIVTLTTPAPQQ